MRPFHPLSAVEQTATHLRAELLAQRLHCKMPGIHQLAAELGVNHKTVKLALGLLEKEGLLVSQGSGKPRRIELKGVKKPLTLRISVLLYEPSDKELSYFNNMLSQLNDAGHFALFAKKTLTELKMDVARVNHFVGKTEADAWVIAGGSKPVLEWFEQQNFPAFALFGRSVNVNLAATAPLKGPALIEAVRHLVALGHQRIVMLAREERRNPQPGLLEQTFLDELEAQSIKTGPYNLPDWEESPERLQEALTLLFKHTPPTALFIQTSQLTVAILQHAAELGLKIPRDLSIISMDPSLSYELCHPLISHISYDSEPWLRRILRWANNIARGKEDRKRVLFAAKFIEGGTIGRAKRFATSTTSY